MQRVKRSTAVAVMPAPPGGGTSGYFAQPNPGGGVPATVPGYEWYNNVQEELVGLVLAAGLTLSDTDTTQLVQSLIKKGLQGCYFNIGTAAGAADAITSSYTPAIAALTNGMTLYVRASTANATTTPTFTPNSGVVPAKTIVKGAGAVLAAGDIAGGGHWIELQFDSVLDKWVLLNPATGIAGAATQPEGTADTTIATTAFVDRLRDVISNQKSASYTLALTDRGKSIDFTGATGQTITVPANASIAFPVGTTITITNTTANNLSIAITTDTLRQAGSANTGTRTLGQYGVATLRKVSATVWIISGVGLT